MNPSELTGTYNKRLHSGTHLHASKSRDNAWEALYEKVLKKHVNHNFTVLDLGSGPGYFINQVEATKKYAVDLDPHNLRWINSDVSFQCTRAQDLNFASDNSIDLVFTTKFLLYFHLHICFGNFL